MDDKFNICNLLHIESHNINALYEYESTTNSKLINTAIIIYSENDIYYCVYDNNNMQEMAKYKLILDKSISTVDNVINLYYDLKCCQNAFFPYTSLLLSITNDVKSNMCISRTLFNKYSNTYSIQQNTTWCKLLTFSNLVFIFNTPINETINKSLLDTIKQHNIQIYYKDIITDVINYRYFYCVCITNEQIEFMRVNYSRYYGSLFPCNLEYIQNFFTKYDF